MAVTKTILGMLLAVATILALAIGTPEASAETAAPPVCLPRGDAVTQLQEQHREEAAGLGLIKGGQAIVEVFVSPAGTWTVFSTDARGRSCVLATGQHWTPISVFAGNGS